MNHSCQKNPRNKVRKTRPNFLIFLPENDVHTDAFPAMGFEFNRPVFWTQNRCLEAFFWPATPLGPAVGCSVVADSSSPSGDVCDGEKKLFLTEQHN